MTAVCFLKTEVVLTQPWIELLLPNLVHLEIRSRSLEDNYIVQLEVEVDLQRQRPPSWKF